MNGRDNLTEEENEISPEAQLDAEIDKFLAAESLSPKDLIAHAYRVNHAIDKAEHRYNLQGKDAVNFANLKIAMKDRLGYKDQRAVSLVECSHIITKEFLIELGKENGISEQEVAAVLPAMAMKLAVSEFKFTLSAFKGGLFFQPKELDNAIKDTLMKYTQRFGL